MSWENNTLQRASAIVRADAIAVLDGRTKLLDPLRNRHLFITGGTGFLGAWLLELLNVLNEDFSFDVRVTVFSRDIARFLNRWPHFAALPWLSFQEGDIRYIAEIPSNVTHVVHAAALTDRRDCSSQPTMVAETNVVGTARVLRACLLLEQLEKFTLLSSGLIYGTQPWDLARMDEGFAGPLKLSETITTFSESKRMAEVFASAALSESKLPLVVLRPFAFVGPYQSLDLPWAITDFIRDSLNGGPIRIMGDGTTVRSIMYASDFAYAVLGATASGSARSVYNVGSNEPVELVELATRITNFFSPIPEIRTKVGRVGHDKNRLVPDTTAIETDLGIHMTVPLNVALQKTIEWHRLFWEC